MPEPPLLVLAHASPLTTPMLAAQVGANICAHDPYTEIKILYTVPRKRRGQRLR
ncbi:hypothetical protein [Pseudomonas extremaustralis]|uniref:hypothetical protein n=1 Tax=Pseudomonas extremaustralis TaxID=359110 RepID=UPI002AA0E206|nr:hypothetical protein [Pseudomonas extremaustralis]